MTQATNQESKEEQIARILEKFRQLSTEEKKLVTKVMQKMVNSNNKEPQE